MEQIINLSQPEKPKNISENTKYIVITAYAALLFLFSFLANSFREIFEGLKEILVSPSILVSDYIEIGNLGSAAFNSSLLMLIAILIAYLNKVHMNGTLIASLFTLGGFALFGKNLYNAISILLGVYLYSRLVKEKFSKFILIAYFGTALGPVVSQISFGLEATSLKHIFIANISGIIAGMLLPPLAGNFVKFHQGFNLYNVGFTCGIIGTFAMSFMRAFGNHHDLVMIVSSGNNALLGTVLILVFASMIIIGYTLGVNGLSNYWRLFRHSGRLVEDFVLMDGFPVTLMNMGVLGTLMTIYILLINGQLNGPTIGGILTVVGFAAFGKHPKNCIPIIIGIFLGAQLQVWDINSTGVVLAALFGTTLAPIAGRFGWLAGILAGFLHLTLVMSLGSLHGGMNLYNNGFSGGLVAATLVPIMETLRKEE